VRKKEVVLIDEKEPLEKVKKARSIPNYPGMPNIGGLSW
jgi:thioredoxin reductase